MQRGIMFRAVCRKVEVINPEYWNLPGITYTTITVKGVMRVFIPVTQMRALLRNK